MRVYLIAAPEDQAEAEKLAEYLKRFGVFIRSEFGQMAYPPAQHGEFTLALWSRNAMMSSRQMMLTNRAIDAWEDGRLVMARMDPGLNPRGLADLDMVDLTFPAAREHRYHDVLNAIRGMEDQRRAALQAEQREREKQAVLREAQEMDLKAMRSEVEMAPRRSLSMEAEAAEMAPPPPSQASRPAPGWTPTAAPARQSTKSKGFPLLPVVIIMIVAGLAGFAYMLGLFEPMASIDGPVSETPPEPSIADPQDQMGIETPLFTLSNNPLLWGGVAGGVVLLMLLVALLRRPKRAKKASVDPVIEEEVVAAEVSDLQPVLEPKPSAEPSAPTEPDGHDAFVSYSHANAETVLPIIESIEQSGLSVWIDRDEMRAGQNWAGQIVRAIKASDRFCLMCSSQAFESDHVRREVYLADKYGKAMVPIRLDESPMPEDIEYFLIGRQWIDLFALDEEERLGAIQDVLNAAED